MDSWCKKLVFTDRYNGMIFVYNFMKRLGSRPSQVSAWSHMELICALYGFLINLLGLGQAETTFFET